MLKLENKGGVIEAKAIRSRFFLKDEAVRAITALPRVIIRK